MTRPRRLLLAALSTVVAGMILACGGGGSKPPVQPRQPNESWGQMWDRMSDDEKNRVINSKHGEYEGKLSK